MPHTRRRGTAISPFKGREMGYILPFSGPYGRWCKSTIIYTDPKLTEEGNYNMNRT